MKQISIWIKKNGENLQDGEVYITDEFAQSYRLQIVSGDYFYGQPDSVKKIAIVEVKNA